MSEFDALMSVGNVLEQDRNNRQALLILLDRQREREDHILALDAKMGNTRSFVTSVPLSWVAQNVRFAGDLPLFNEYRDPVTNVINLNRESAAIVQQRAPDWTRQFPMTLYLAKRRRHKFPPILVVITQAWVDTPTADEWDSAHCATRDSVNAQSLDTLGRYLDLHITESDTLYALDGQHRLMAIKGLSDLLGNGKLFSRDKNGKEKSTNVSIDEILAASKEQVSRSQLQQLLAERIGIEIIPAVLKGETRKQALLRIRSIFVHVNRTAQPLDKGELALLDEDDGFAVIARLVAYGHPLFKDRLQLKKGNLPATSEDLTALETMWKISLNYLSQFPKYADWKPDSKTEMAMRPEEEGLHEGYKEMTDYFDALATIPSYKRVLQGGSCRISREEEGNILFRPLAQMALAEAVGYLVAHKNRTLHGLVQTLSAKESETMLSYLQPTSPWYKVVFDPLKGAIERASTAQKLITRLFIHLLGGGTSDENAYLELKRDFAQARIVDHEKEIGVDLKDARVHRDKIDLPSPW